MIRLFKRLISSRFLNKILLINCIVIILSIFLVSTVISSRMRDEIYRREVEFGHFVLENLNIYMNEKYATTKRILYQTYSNQQVYNNLNAFLTTEQDMNNPAYIRSWRHFEDYLASSASTDNSMIYLMVYKRLDSTLYTKERMRTIFNDTQLATGGTLLQIAHSPYVDAYILPSSELGLTVERHPHTYTILNNVRVINTSSTIGTLLLTFSCDDLSELVGKYYGPEDGSITFINRDGHVLFDSSARLYGQSFPSWESLSEGDSEIAVDGVRTLQTVLRNHKFGMTIVKQTPFSSIYSSLNTVQVFVTGLTLLTILVSALINMGFVNSFSRRIRQIMQVISQIKRHDFQVPIPSDRKLDELSEIQASFGEMCASLNEYIDRAYVAQLQKKTAELSALQFQINPHFLYNTLESIRMYALDLGGGEVSEMVFLLAQIFRESVNSELVVTVDDEISSAMLYVQLFEVRYADKLTLHTDIAQDVGGCATLRLLLQPIVENYIIHGFDPTREDNVLSITGRLMGDFVELKVIDNGKGIPEGKQDGLFAKKDTEGRGIGLANVMERMKLAFGSEASICVDSAPNQGTCVTIRFRNVSKEELRLHV